MKIKPNEAFRFILVVLIILFLAIYILGKGGYYAYNNYEKTVITAENIKQFEEDVASGKKIDINNYLENSKNYSNKISNTSLKISNTIGKYVKKSLTNIFKTVNKLIE